MEKPVEHGVLGSFPLSPYPPILLPRPSDHPSTAVYRGLPAVPHRLVPGGRVVVVADLLTEDVP